MSDKVKPIPEGYGTVTPYLIVDGAARAIEFYKEAFGAEESFRMEGPGGRVGHAEIKIGDSHVMLADEHPEMGARGPQSFGGSPISLVLYVEDVDATVRRAVKAGAKLTRPVANQFYGDRTGGLEDPFGHAWYVATHVEDVSEEEMKKRAAAAHQGGA
ncbi:MAG: VOC family protein [Acidobacteriota bacterium]|nr:VOC family protein [Acidobacteriota bacterium]MDQ5839168.1 VOC family protein [Acidobacteriota bacterium]